MPLHAEMLTSSKAPVAAALASARFISNASSRASRRFSSNSSRVWPWELTPGTSSTQPIHHSPCCWITAVTPRNSSASRGVRPMRIVLDESVPRPLVRIFGPSHYVATVQDLGLAGMANGPLLAQLEGRYDVFVTADQNLRYQQNLAGRSLAIVELPTNRLRILR